MFASHPVPIVYASAPLLKPKPIRPSIDTNVQASCCNRTLIQPKHVRRPFMLRASTLDGRSLSEVINAAHRASLNEQPKRQSKSPASLNDHHSDPDSRRMSFDGPSSSFSEYRHRRSSAYDNRADSFFDQHSYADRSQVITSPNHFL